MAIELSSAESLRKALSDPAIIQGNAFEIIQEITRLAVGANEESLLQEMVLRALEHRDAFGSSKPILDTLVRRVGLFPYLQPQGLSLADQIAYEFHRPSNMGEDVVFHRPQAQVYRALMQGDNVILSAPTSFGKSLIIDAVIAAGSFRNVLIIVPTIALIDETRRRLAERFSGMFKVITHASQSVSERNIFVFTQERAIDFEGLTNVDFFVVDEFYKLTPGRDEDERCSVLNQVFYRLVKTHAQFYLLGPNILSLSGQLHERLSYKFLLEQYHTVVSQVHDMSGRGKPLPRMIELCRTLSEPTIIFCGSPGRARDVAKEMIEAGLGYESEEGTVAARWLAQHYHSDWHFSQAISRGIGVHHGRIPRALAQYVVRAFDSGHIKWLVCTSTLIEGVNTKAKNIIILDNKINREAIDLFTFNNIKGRSGRMGKHFIGDVYLFHEPPENKLPFVDVPAFTQSDDAPDSLLIQIDKEELTDKSRRRLESFSKQRHLSYEVLRSNKGIAPSDQIQLAREIEQNPRRYSLSLSWSGIPTVLQVQFIAGLMWEHFNGAHLARGSVVSAKQLAFMINGLRNRPTVRDLIQGQLGYNNNADAVVQQVLDFLRLWAGFHFPRLLRAIERIQRDVLGRLRYPFGDYSYFASQVESQFLDPAITALDEYGVPLELARKLAGILRPDGDVDLALDRVKHLNVGRLSLDQFEKGLLLDAQKHI